MKNQDVSDKCDGCRFAYYERDTNFFGCKLENDVETCEEREESKRYKK